MMLHRSGAKHAVVILAFSALAACGHSPPTQFFTLDPVQPRDAHTATIGKPVRIDVVHIPPELDRLSMVRETSTNQLKIDDQNRWAGSLSDLLRQALTQDLTSRLSPGQVVAPDAASPPGARTIAVNVLRFQPTPSGDVVLEGSWSLLDGDAGKPIIRRQIHLTEKASDATASAQATAMSHLIASLAEAIVQQLSAGT
jgi:hypothetical protein